MTIRPAEPADAERWCALRHDLWPDGSPAEHAGEIAAFFAGTVAEPKQVLVAEDEAGRLVGFVELSLRAYAEGCATSPVAYLEGWHVVAERRRTGVGRALIAAAAGWGRAQGCRELASDAEADNVVSAHAHVASGFEDVGLIRCFRMALDGWTSPG